jgi:hypothetical protein
LFGKATPTPFGSGTFSIGSGSGKIAFGDPTVPNPFAFKTAPNLFGTITADTSKMAVFGAPSGNSGSLAFGVTKSAPGGKFNIQTAIGATKTSLFGSQIQGVAPNSPDDTEGESDDQRAEDESGDDQREGEEDYEDYDDEGDYEDYDDDEGDYENYEEEGGEEGDEDEGDRTGSESAGEVPAPKTVSEKPFTFDMSGFSDSFVETSDPSDKDQSAREAGRPQTRRAVSNPASVPVPTPKAEKVPAAPKAAEASKGPTPKAGQRRKVTIRK